MIWFVDLNVGNRPVDGNWPCLFCYQKFCDASLFKVLYMWLRHWVKAFSHKICWKLWDRRGAWQRRLKFPKFIASSINAFRCLRLWCVVRSMVESDLKKTVLNYIIFSAENWKRSYYSTVKHLHSIWMVWMQFLLNQTLSILHSGKPTHSLIMFIVRVSFLNLLQGTSFQPYSK